MYLAASEILQDHGYEHYEISNFARPGLRSRHNLKYWTGGEYLGFGPCAASGLCGQALHHRAGPARLCRGHRPPRLRPLGCETIPPRERRRGIRHAPLAHRHRAGRAGVRAQLPAAPLRRCSSCSSAFAAHGLAAQSGSRWYLTPPRLARLEPHHPPRCRMHRKKSTPLAKKR